MTARTRSRGKQERVTRSDGTVVVQTIPPRADVLWFRGRVAIGTGAPQARRRAGAGARRGTVGRAGDRGLGAQARHQARIRVGDQPRPGHRHLHPRLLRGHRPARGQPAGPLAPPAGTRSPRGSGCRCARTPSDRPRRPAPRSGRCRPADPPARSRSRRRPGPARREAPRTGRCPGERGRPSSRLRTSLRSPISTARSTFGRSCAVMVSREAVQSERLGDGRDLPLVLLIRPAGGPCRGRRTGSTRGDPGLRRARWRSVEQEHQHAHHRDGTPQRHEEDPPREVAHRTTLLAPPGQAQPIRPILTRSLRPDRSVRAPGRCHRHAAVHRDDHLAGRTHPGHRPPR